MGMFGWVMNSRIAAVLRIKIEITIVHPNANSLFRNSKNNCYSAIRWGDEILVVILNSPLLFQTIFLPFRIESHFYYPRANRKITIFLLSSLVILNSSILALFFARSKHNPKKQATIACSSTEAEYHGLTTATTEIVWLQSLFLELSISIPTPDL
jgi:hypothetical protein